MGMRSLWRFPGDSKGFFKKRKRGGGCFILTFRLILAWCWGTCGARDQTHGPIIHVLQLAKLSPQP